MFLALVGSAVLLGLGHHVDHVLRGNHVGWPLTPEITPFTVSLLAYPMVAVGLGLGWEDRLARGYWGLVLLASTAFVGLTHFGPTAVERPADIAGVYEEAWIGGLALAWLVAFTLVLLSASALAAAGWLQGRGNG